MECTCPCLQVAFPLQFTLGHILKTSHWDIAVVDGSNSYTAKEAPFGTMIPLKITNKQWFQLSAMVLVVRNGCRPSTVLQDVFRWAFPNLLPKPQDPFLRGTSVWLKESVQIRKDLEPEECFLFFFFPVFFEIGSCNLQVFFRVHWPPLLGGSQPSSSLAF